MDEVVKKIASLGLPGVLFAVALSITTGAGLAGAAATTSALAMLGGPFGGMVAGIMILVGSSAVADVISHYGIETLLQAVYEKRVEQGESREKLCREIGSLWLSDSLRYRLRQKIACPHPTQTQSSQSDIDKQVDEEIAKDISSVKGIAPAGKSSFFSSSAEAASGMWNGISTYVGGALDSAKEQVKHGIMTVLYTIYTNRIKRGETQEQICHEIDTNLPMAEELKQKLKEQIREYQVDMPDPSDPSASKEGRISKFRSGFSRHVGNTRTMVGEQTQRVGSFAGNLRSNLFDRRPKENTDKKVEETNEIFISLYLMRIEQGEPLEQIYEEIDTLPIADDFKNEMRKVIASRGEKGEAENS